MKPEKKVVKIGAVGALIDRLRLLERLYTYQNDAKSIKSLEKIQEFLNREANQETFVEIREYLQKGRFF